MQTVDGTVLKYFSPTYGKTESAFAAIDENENKIDGTAGGEIAVQLTAEDGSRVLAETDFFCQLQFL